MFTVYSAFNDGCCDNYLYTSKEIRLRFAAIKDSLLGKVGKHDLYKPGWKP